MVVFALADRLGLSHLEVADWPLDDLVEWIAYHRIRKAEEN